jgi:hypothetical protein
MSRYINYPQLGREIERKKEKEAEETERQIVAAT